MLFLPFAPAQATIKPGQEAGIYGDGRLLARAESTGTASGSVRQGSSVGVIWLNHHGLFRHIRYVDLRLNWINLGILGTAALIPLPMGVLAHAFEAGDLNDQRAAVVFYAVVAALMSAAWLPMFPYLMRNTDLLAASRPANAFRDEAR
jgi:hypothetical protein